MKLAAKSAEITKTRGGYLFRFDCGEPVEIRVSSHVFFRVFARMASVLGNITYREVKESTE